MFVVSLTYKVELDKIEEHLDGHIKYLELHYALGHFLASGRKVPRNGGVILADVKTRKTLDEVLSEDPFKLNSVADYDVIEFIPTKTSKELSHLLFRTQMHDVTPITVNRADKGQVKKNKHLHKTRQLLATSSIKKMERNDLSDQFIHSVEPEEILYWTQPGVVKNQLYKLKKGLIPFKGSVDLHGLTIDSSRTLLCDFLQKSQSMNIRCVKITHGKGKTGRIKSYVNSWLQQHSQVIAFCSCLPKHGGAGAAYVLLKRLNEPYYDE